MKLAGSGSAFPGLRRQRRYFEVKGCAWQPWAFLARCYRIKLSIWLDGKAGVSQALSWLLRKAAPEIHAERHLAPRLARLCECCSVAKAARTRPRGARTVCSTEERSRSGREGRRW